MDIQPGTNSKKMVVSGLLKKPSKAIKDTHIPITRKEVTRAQLNNCTVFSKLDFESEFNQLQLDPGL